MCLRKVIFDKVYEGRLFGLWGMELSKTAESFRRRRVTLPSARHGRAILQWGSVVGSLKNPRHTAVHLSLGLQRCWHLETRGGVTFAFLVVSHLNFCFAFKLALASSTRRHFQPALASDCSDVGDRVTFN